MMSPEVRVMVDEVSLRASGETSYAAITAAGVAAGQGRPAGELGQFAGELPRSVDDDYLRGVARLVHDLDPRAGEMTM